MSEKTEIFGWNIRQGDYSSGAHEDRMLVEMYKRSIMFKRGAVAFISTSLLLGFLLAL